MLTGSTSMSLSRFDAVGSASWIHTFSPRIINEARAQFDFNDELTGTNDKFGPALELAGTGNFNRDRFLPSDVITRRTEPHVKLH